jgi:hypothetical protein
VVAERVKILGNESDRFFRHGDVAIMRMGDAPGCQGRARSLSDERLQPIHERKPC